MTDLQEMKMFMSQLKTASGFDATLMRSNVRAKAAAQPRMPKMIEYQAYDFDGLSTKSSAVLMLLTQ